MHARIPGPIRVRLADGGGQPLANRTVTMLTTSVTAPQYSFVTDATGEVSFPDVRAGLALGPETITFRSLGVGDQTATVIATEPPLETIFTVLNGARNDRTIGVGGPAYDATSSGLHTSGLDTTADGTIYFATDERVLRIRPDGATEWVVGRGCCGYTLPTGDQSIDALTEARLGAAPRVRVDPVRPLLYVAQGCGIYQVDLATSRMTRFAGDRTACAYTGDGGAADRRAARGPHAARRPRTCWSSGRARRDTRTRVRWRARPLRCARRHW